MQTQTFGKTGFRISPLGFGSAPVGFLKTDRERAGAMLNFMLDHGVNLIDTAAMYEGAEVLIGETIGHRRDDYILVSKCGHKIPEAPAGGPFSPEAITATVDRALARLKTDHLDVMLLHSCDLKTLQKGEALQALVKARDAGKVTFVGYSGDNDAAVHAAGLEDVAVIETSVSLADQHNIDTVLPACVSNNVGVLAKRPIANAAWKDISTQQGFYKNYAKTYTERLSKMQLNPTDLGVAGPLEKAWPELALRFTLSQPGVHCAIIGTTNPDNATFNLDLVKKGHLPAETIQKIRAAFHQADPEGKWLGQT